MSIIKNALGIGAVVLSVGLVVLLLSGSFSGGKLTAWPGKAYPRLVKRLEQLSCHGGILSELRLSLNRRLGGRNRVH